MVWQNISSIQKKRHNTYTLQAPHRPKKRKTLASPIYLIALFLPTQMLLAQITHIPIPQIESMQSPQASMPQVIAPKNPNAQAPQIPTTAYPTMPTMPTQDEEKAQLASNTLFQDLITDALKRKMILRSSCMADTITTEGFGKDEVQRLGMPLYLTPIQYQDNILRLRALQLKYANKEAQKQFILTQKSDLKGVRIVLEFLIQNAPQHTIALSPQYAQINGVLFEGSPQILQTFQAYFCHAQTLK